MDLNEIAIFVDVIRAGSFSKAAQKLGMPNSTVSSKVSSLEKRLGTTLIQRTTRKLNITPAGEKFYAQALEALEKINSAEASLAEEKREPSGTLRITAPVDLGTAILPDLVTSFSAKFKKVSVEIVLTDRNVDLLADGVDLAIRAGELKDSSLIAKRLGSVYFTPFASPKFLKSIKRLDHPKDLEGVCFVGFTPLHSRSNNEVRLKNDRATVKAKVETKMMVNDLNVVKSLALSGAGIALLPTFMCKAETKNSKLIPLFPDWFTDMAPVHFVYPAQKFVSPKLSAFIAHATDPLRGYLS